MPPEQTPPPQSSYGFIMNPGSAPKRKLIPSGGSLKNRLVVAGAAGIVIMILIVLGVSLFTKSAGNNTQLLIDLAEEQQEVIRVSSFGAQATDLNLRSQALTAQLSVESDQYALLGALKADGTKIKAKTLSLKKDPKTDAALASARAANLFDQTFATLLQTTLIQYRADTKKAYDSAHKPVSKQILANSYNSATTLLTAPAAK
jgi:hypothetical protein